MTQPTIAQQLRQVAEDLRKVANHKSEAKMLKVAKVLSAARALSDLRRLYGK